MDIVVKVGDQLIIEVDVSNDSGPVDLSGAQVRYVAGIVDFNQDNDEIEIVTVNTVPSQVRITYSITEDMLGHQRHECKIKKNTLGPSTILDGTVYVEPSLIGAEV